MPLLSPLAKLTAYDEMFAGAEEKSLGFARHFPTYASWYDVPVLDAGPKLRAWGRTLDEATPALRRHTGALPHRFDALHSAMQIVVAFPVDEERVGAGLAERIKEDVRFRDHHVQLEVQAGDSPE